jgi:hypothetical protein
VLALAEVALHAQRPAFGIGDDDGVRALGLAGAAQVLDLVTGSKRPPARHGAIFPWPAPAASVRETIPAGSNPRSRSR